MTAGKLTFEDGALTLDDINETKQVLESAHQVAKNLGIKNRGWLAPGYYGDVALFADAPFIVDRRAGLVPPRR